MLTEKAAILNRLLSLLSLTAVQRLNSDTAEKAQDESWTKTLLLEGSGSGRWANLSGTVDHCLSTLLNLLTKPWEIIHLTTVFQY